MDEEEGRDEAPTSIPESVHEEMLGGHWEGQTGVNGGSQVSEQGRGRNPLWAHPRC